MIQEGTLGLERETEKFDPTLLIERAKGYDGRDPGRIGMPQVGLIIERITSCSPNFTEATP
ncbi:hypothetical protein AVDCRST_MAG81-315 [uncultured Synechococcales cyanobacterium]|uniref:Uncharacterized protein n=1 Tax=uncultured Synechococcales cyanobacterium TaxID=1936017 RepID=A0A6J4URL9_9CYAN|nr:hypothetical protein AVDCRST_MAG81-315 [uncultured Synechococcales cyanobacterium]